MDNLEKTESQKDMRCHSLHFFYKIVDSEVFFHKEGYITVIGEQATNIPSLDEDITMGENERIEQAKALNIPLENITRLSRDEYLDATKNSSSIKKTDVWAIFNDFGHLICIFNNENKAKSQVDKLNSKRKDVDYFSNKTKFYN